MSTEIIYIPPPPYVPPDVPFTEEGSDLNYVQAGLGNPLGYELGGGNSAQGSAYDALFQAVGDGLQAPVDSIVEAWRVARARGLVAALMDERALFQNFPHLATDFIQTWEDILLPDVAGLLDSDQARRDRLKERYTRLIEATYPALTAYLTGLNPLFSIHVIPPEQTRTTVGGVRAFEDFDPSNALASGPAYGVYDPGGHYRKQTLVPNYSDDLVLFVQLSVGPGSFTLANQRAVLDAQDALNEVLPSWVDFRLYTAVGFILDQDLLDVTVFGT